MTSNVLSSIQPWLLRYLIRRIHDSFNGRQNPVREEWRRSTELWQPDLSFWPWFLGCL